MMNELMNGLALFGGLTIGVLVLLPVFLLQKAIAEGQRKESEEREGHFENHRPL